LLTVAGAAERAEPLTPASPVRGGDVAWGPPLGAEHRDQSGHERHQEDLAEERSHPAEHQHGQRRRRRGEAGADAVDAQRTVNARRRADQVADLAPVIMNAAMTSV